MTELTINNAEHAVAVCILAHGAGAGKDHDWLQEITEYLIQQQITVVRFNFPYMAKRALDGKKRPPDKFEKLEQVYLSVINDAQVRALNLPIFLTGKSMGGRVAASINQQDLTKQHLGVICLGYPFHPIGKPEKLRLTPLQSPITRSVMILQGERDTMGNKQAVADYQLSEQVAIYWLEDGDHNLKPRVRSGYCLAQHLQCAAQKIREFIDEQITTCQTA